MHMHGDHPIQKLTSEVHDTILCHEQALQDVASKSTWHWEHCAGTPLQTSEMVCEAVTQERAMAGRNLSHSACQDECK